MTDVTMLRGDLFMHAVAIDRIPSPCPLLFVAPCQRLPAPRFEPRAPLSGREIGQLLRADIALEASS